MISLEVFGHYSTLAQFRTSRQLRDLSNTNLLEGMINFRDQYQDLMGSTESYTLNYLNVDKHSVLFTMCKWTKLLYSLDITVQASERQLDHLALFKSIFIQGSRQIKLNTEQYGGDIGDPDDRLPEVYQNTSDLYLGEGTNFPLYCLRIQYGLYEDDTNDVILKCNGPEDLGSCPCLFSGGSQSQHPLHHPILKCLYHPS
jgi:hypothetical protein